MKKMTALLLILSLVMISGCGEEHTSSESAEVTTTAVTTQPAPVGELAPEREYSAEIQQLMEAVKFDGVYCEQELTRICVERITPDYVEILGAAADPSSYTDGENGAAAEEQALQYIESMVQYQYAYNGRIYFSVTEENTFSIYSINVYTEDMEMIFTADAMGYEYYQLIDVSNSGVVWRCANANDMSVYNDDAEVSIYCQSYSGEPYCLDGFFGDHPVINTAVANYVFWDNRIYYVDQVSLELDGKSDYVPCVFAYDLATEKTHLYKFNSWNVRRQGNSISYDSCDPDELRLPYTDEYAVHTKYDTALYDLPMYQYTEYTDGYDGEPQYGYLLKGENRQPIKLFLMTDSYDIPTVAKDIAACGYTAGNGKSYMAVMDYTEGKMCAVQMDVYGERFAHGSVIYMPQNDGSIITIRRV